MRAQVGLKSAIGEQYVELTPESADGPYLATGDLIPRDRTSSPLPVEELIGNLDALAGSLPREELSVALDELNKAATGLGQPLGRLIDYSDQLSAASLEGSDDLIALIKDARTVLDTQLDLAPDTARFLAELAGLTDQFNDLGIDIAALFADGVRAGSEVSGLLADNATALSLLLDDLLSLTTVVADRLPSVRKTLVVFPWLLELGGTTFRYCEDLDAVTGTPVEATCDYDEFGDPVVKSWLAQVMDHVPPAFQPCTRGYGGTRKFQPDGTAVDGGAAERPFEEPNLEAACTAAPTDPTTPNVRGAQNVPDYLPPGSGALGRSAPAYAAYDADTGLLVTPQGTYRLLGRTGPPPPRGNDGLEWLLGQPMAG